MHVFWTPVRVLDKKQVTYFVFCFFCFFVFILFYFPTVQHYFVFFCFFFFSLFLYFYGQPHRIRSFQARDQIQACFYLCHSCGNNAGSFIPWCQARDRTCILGASELPPIPLRHNGNSANHFLVQLGYSGLAALTEMKITAT